MGDRIKRRSHRLPGQSPEDRARARTVLVGQAIGLVALAAGNFAFDLAVPMGVAGGVLYVALVLAGLWLPWRGGVLVLALTGTILTIADHFLSPQGAGDWVVLSNRGLAIAAIWTVAIIAFERFGTQRGFFVAGQAAQRSIAAFKQLKAALDASEARKRGLFEHAGIGMGIADASGRIIDVNPALANMLGYARHELIGRTIAEITHPDDVDHNLDLRREMLAGGRSGFVLETRFLRKNGVTLWARVTSTAVRDDDGSYAFSIAVIEDITARKHAENALQESEARYRAIFENSGMGIGIADKDNRIIDANPALSDMLGYDREELLRLAIADITHPDDLRRNLELRSDVLSNDAKSYCLEKRYIRKDGQHLWTRLTGTVIRDANGDFAYSLGLVEDIMERKRTEEALQQSEARYRTVFENSAIGFSIVDANLRLVDANPAFLDMIGYDHSELAGLTLEHVTHPDDLARSLEPREDLVSGKSNGYVVEKRLIRKDGAVIWTRVTANAIRDGDGSFAFSLAAVEDITARRQAEDELRQSEMRLGEAQRIAGVGSWEWDVTANATHWSDEHFRIFGLEPRRAPVTFESFLASIHPDDHARVTAAVDHTLRSGEPYSVEYRIRRPDGSERIGHSRGEVFFDGADQPVRMRGTVQDITERKRAEQDLAQSEARLAEAQRIAGVGSWGLNLVSGELYWSDEVYRILGLDKGRVMLTAKAYIERIHPDDRPRVKQIIREKNKAGKSYSDEYRIIRPDGEVRTVFTIVEYDLDEAGRPLWRRGTIQDVTERKRIERALSTAKEEAEAANRAKSAFLANMSHELRTPLSAIIGFAELIKKEAMGPIGDRRYIEYAEDIRESGQHLSALIGDILDLAKIEAGKIDLREGEVNVADAVQACLTMLTGHAEAHDVRIVEDFPADSLPVLRADSRRVRQILTNLLANALKFTQSGGTVTVSARADGRTGFVL